MRSNTIEVDWYAYAKEYDLLLTYNPFYQELRREVLTYLKTWSIVDQGVIADIGAGTGNYSVAAAEIFPQAQILHIDNNEGMNKIASEKAANLQNFQVVSKSIDALNLDRNSLSGVICINAIYTFPDPRMTLKNIYNWLAPGGQAILVDPGRIMPLLSFKIAIARHMIKNYGLRQTLQVFRSAKAVQKQNAYIREMQVNGTFWTHTHEGFCEAVREAGFHIASSKVCFKGCCDFVVVQKLSAAVESQEVNQEQTKSDYLT